MRTASVRAATAAAGLAMCAVLAACSGDLAPDQEVGRLSSLIAPLVTLSRTHLPPAADDAIDLCFVTRDKIAGIALVPHARDVWLYAPLTGREPELQSEAPAWVIQVRGRLRQPLAPGTSVDPTCVVVNGIAATFETGGWIDDTGRFQHPTNVVHPPGTLPPLGP